MEYTQYRGMSRLGVSAVNHNESFGAPLCTSYALRHAAQPADSLTFATFS